MELLRGKPLADLIKRDTEKKTEDSQTENSF